jgi:hypothetical protein
MLDRSDICRLTAIFAAMTMIVAATTLTLNTSVSNTHGTLRRSRPLPRPAPPDRAAIPSQPIDDSSPLSLTPDRGYGRGNVWLMGYEPGWSHLVD